MKNAPHLPMALIVFAIACNTPNTNSDQKDSSQKVTGQVEEIAGGNFVKAEAPDAVAKSEQGYALPYSNEKLVQSPINILSDSTLKDGHQVVSIEFKTVISAVENLGHTIQLDFAKGSTVLAYGRIYSSRQFHFHTPSEHLIDGMTFPMEMHIVNVLKDSNEKNNPQYLVVGLLFKMGRENKFINEFLQNLPKEENKDSLQPGTADFDDFFRSISKNGSGGYYSYKGSLTTTPYSETVNWMVKKSVLEASPEQIIAIEKLEGNNARHVQALYARKVLNQ